MPVLELSLLRLLVPPDSSLLSTLSLARSAVESFSTFPNTFRYLVSPPPSVGAPPTHIYIFGHWASVAQHFEDWIPSEANRSIMAELKHKVVVEWLVHVEGGLEGLGLELGMGGLGNGEEKSGEKVRVARYVVKEGERAEVEGLLERLGVTGRWRVDVEEGALEELDLMDWNEEF
ncbi:hypothetical protein BDY21DRAFT_365796 [Lineolata rhizophorae]|uniref:ABM domain-containing protein n=1 Tax=Lineolata rhizophorae TaxID=578093 RepID=A0A6A6NTY1_9PEZI|nr:hypothetical protein BDY21DRAFT_365796 [Lineolata rhizophorae]